MVASMSYLLALTTYVRSTMYNEKNTPRRKGSDDKKYAENWDKIFGKKKEKKSE